MAYELIDDTPEPKRGFELLPDEPVAPDMSRSAILAGIPLIGPLLSPSMPAIAKGVASGFADLGNTIINSGTKAGADTMAGIDDPYGLIDPRFKRAAPGALSPSEQENAERAKSLQQFNEDNKSTPFAAGRLVGNVAATYPIGGAIAAPLKAAIPAAAPLANAIASGGFRTGLAPVGTIGKLGNVALRSVGGAVNGATSVAAVDPASTSTGALIGAALPATTAALGGVGSLIGRSLMGGQKVAPEVQKLAQRAEELGIKVPADRIADSKPLNAVAAGLNYVPFSGRAATEEAMQTGLNRALSRTFGQDSPNVTMALRKAQGDLGGKFDTVLKNNAVNVDQQFITELAEAANRASRELGSEGASIIGRQVDDIMAKAATGQIDGQAAYNVKKTLDRIGNTNQPYAFYARDLKSALMGALDRSLGPQQAAEFALTRRQYGNMLSLENLAKNGAEGDVSIARLANMKNIRSPDLQELADISAQFLKPREGMHGAAQRAFAGMGVGATAGLPALAGAVAAGRVTNGLLNSSIARNAVLGTGGQGLLGASIPAQGLLYQGAPALLRDQ